MTLKDLTTISNINTVMANIFDKLELEAFKAGITPRTQQSRDWFRRKAQQIRRVNRNAIMKEEPIQLSNRQIVGSMYMFFYDPKLKETLPYYDSFPLVIVIGPAEGGFLGLNLHYIQDPEMRLKVLFNLTGIDRKDVPPNFRLNVTYDKNDPLMKLCVKHYLRGHIRSNFIKIPVEEWENIVPLETARWVYNTRKRKP